VSARVRGAARPVVLAALVGILVTAATGSLASNVVTPSRLGGFSMSTGANELKPIPECSGISLQSIDAGSGTFSTSNSDELVLGSAGIDSINARNGDDCVVAGDGNDTINGGVGRDVCIGGPGTDTFNACETAIQ
jgi:Ca2+-binding RTX toxin-like protein